MDLNEPLPRLLRLRGMVAQAAPSPDANVDQFSAEGLVGGYNSLRDAVAQASAELGVSADEFPAQFARLDAMENVRLGHGPRAHIDAMNAAKTAALQLRKLVGYIEGLIEAVVLDQQISMEHVQAAREAARQPPGFR
ncbi:MAG TPA: hypothetical protein VF587_06005 [Solirubrobacteraceae bacterium]